MTGRAGCALLYRYRDRLGPRLTLPACGVGSVGSYCRSSTPPRRQGSVGPLRHAGRYQQIQGRVWVRTRPAPARMEFPVTSLAHLPEHRRETLLLRYADKLDYDGVDALVRERSQEPCRWKIGPPAITGELTAIPGDDGRYHLCADGRPRCTGNWSPQYDTSAYLHRQQCGWWTDGTSYRAQPPPGSGHEPQRQSHRQISWLVFLRGEATDPGLVPPSHRAQTHSPAGSGRPTRTRGLPWGTSALR